MKITIVKNNQSEKRKIYIDDVGPGYVFEFLNGVSNHPKALKLEKNKAVLLIYSSGVETFELCDGSILHYPVRILGKLTEIVVKE